MKLFAAIVVSGFCVLAPELAAQAKEPVPKQYRPPPGMCRIWLNDVPPGRQPEPIDCATAIRRRPPNARVIFGEQPSPEFRLLERDKVRERSKPRIPVKKLKPDEEKPEKDPEAAIKQHVRPPQHNILSGLPSRKRARA